MKIKYTYIIITLFLSSILFGQQLTLGIQWGGTSSFYSITNNKNSKSIQTYMYGAFADLSINNMLIFSVEANYIKKGGELKRGSTSIFAKPFITYLSIPLMTKVGIKLPKIYLYVTAGPRLDIAIEENDERLVGLYNNRSNINLGTSVGAGFSLFLNKRNSYLGFELRYNPDLTGFDVNSYDSFGITTYQGDEKFKSNSIELIAKLGISLK